MPNLRLLPFSIAVILGVLVYRAPANASLIGQDVRFQSIFSAPPTNDVFTVVEGDPLDPGADPELTLFNQFEVDVEEASLRITWLITGSVVAGFVWSELDWGAPGEIIGATTDPSSTWAENDVPTFTASTVTLESFDLVVPGDFVLINLDVAHVIPEPGTLALFGLGLAGIVFVRRKRAA